MAGSTSLSFWGRVIEESQAVNCNKNQCLPLIMNWEGPSLYLEYGGTTNHRRSDFCPAWLVCAPPKKKDDKGDNDKGNDETVAEDTKFTDEILAPCTDVPVGQADEQEEEPQKKRHKKDNKDKEKNFVTHQIALVDMKITVESKTYMVFRPILIDSERQDL